MEMSEKTGGGEMKSKTKKIRKKNIALLVFLFYAIEQKISNNKRKETSEQKNVVVRGWTGGKYAEATCAIGSWENDAKM